MLDDALDRVYGAPLDEFTSERNRLSKELAAQGDSDGATRLKKMKKPSVSTWAVNQLARRHPKEVGELVALHERLAEASDSQQLRQAQEERKKVVSRLTDAATRILEEAGHSALSGTLQRVSQTLLAASDGDDLTALEQGRLQRDLEPSGFDAVAGFDLAANSQPFTKSDRKARDEAQDLDRRAVEAEAHAADARKAAEAATAEAERLTEAAAKAVRRAETARQKAERALDRLG